jgi:hypothetical protein
MQGRVWSRVVGVGVGETFVLASPQQIISCVGRLAWLWSLLAGNGRHLCARELLEVKVRKEQKHNDRDCRIGTAGMKPSPDVATLFGTPYRRTSIDDYTTA